MNLRLRAPEPADVDWMFGLENDPSLWECGDGDMPVSRHRLQQFVDEGVDIPEHRQGRLIVYDDKPLAMLDLYDVDMVNRRAWVGIVVDPAHRRHGIAAASLNLLAQYAAKRLGLCTLWTVTAADNDAALKAFSKAGFIKVAILPSYLWRDRESRDAVLLTRTTA